MTRNGTVAIKNVAAFMTMTMRLIKRAPHLPGFGVCHGPSGLGKTYASIFAQNKFKAARVEVGDSWTKRTLLKRILNEFNESMSEKATISAMTDRAVAALAEDIRRPLIIDEADKLVDKGMIELVRELQETSNAPVILIGEEKLPAKLLTVERMHNRVLDWFAAQPCDIDDTRELAKAFAPKLTIADDLLNTFLLKSGGRARRIVVNLHHAEEFARNKGLNKLDLKIWGSNNYFTGAIPKERSAKDFDMTREVAD